MVSYLSSIVTTPLSCRPTVSKILSLNYQNLNTSRKSREDRGDESLQNLEWALMQIVLLDFVTFQNFKHLVPDCTACASGDGTKTNPDQNNSVHYWD